jgi:magnesium-transporting ATPase (P-type)
MGTVVQEGGGQAVVVETGADTQFGAIAGRLGEAQPETGFQAGLRDFSKMLVTVTVIMAVVILVVNLLLGHPAIESILFALSIAVGLTPQLLPAIVTVSLSTGARRLARRKVVVQRKLGADVGFMGDGVNDAVALHDADCGISVQTATDVARDAADIVLLDKDLGILADGIAEGRRTFSNTMKYVMMGTSSNFGNMFSAGAASLFLSFLPMLPTQILLNNLLYDISEMTIPTDNVDPEQLEKPAHWDVRMIRRFMVFFGPISSIFDFATFGIMLGVFDAHAPLFRSGWFVESLATQSLVIFAIRTRRVPFFRSRASKPLTLTTILCVAIGPYLPYSPLAHALGFRPPAGGLLRVPPRNGHRLRGAGRARQDVLLSPPAGGAASRGPDSAQARASSRLALECPEARVKGPAAREPAPSERRRSGCLASSLAKIGSIAAS